MKNLFILINVLCLFLTSCGNLPVALERTPAGEENCTTLMKDFLSPVEKERKYLTEYLKMDLDKEEVSDFFKYFSEYNPTHRDVPTFRAIFYFSNGDAEVRKSLLSEFRKEVAGSETDPKNEMWKKFTAHRTKVEKKTKTMPEEKVQVYQKLYYSCKSQVKAKPTPESARMAKRLTYALTAGGLGSSAVTYTTVNWDKEKDTKWFNELYFTLGISLVFTYIAGKFVLANDKLHPWKGKMPITFFNAAASDIGVSGVYHYFFNTSDKEFEQKLNELKKDPQGQEKLQEILKVAEEEGLFEKYAEDSAKLFVDKKSGKPLAKEAINLEDVDIEASRELLIDAIATKEYEDNSGVLSTGSAAVDRFSYHRLYNILSVPANIGLSLVMYNQMCMSEDPKKGFTKAVATYMAGSLVLDAIYFQGRRDLINQ